ncbi:MAG TPA: type II secretion system F family protein [Lacipirellulaceae bacterium]|jgi:tight adherence protein C|nr:type II secretion system F family protein [Lacipirellulaceae bacterium]
MLTFAAIISAELLTKCAIFGAAACGAWLLMEILAKSKPRSEQRLEELRDPSRRRGGSAGEGGVTKKADGIGRLLEKASPRMARPLQPKTEAEVGKLRAKLNYAGFRGETAPSIFLGLKTICLAVGFVGGGGGMLLSKGATGEAFMYTIGVAGVAFYLPDAVLWFLKKSRQDNIFFGLPDALDLMVVCVEAGLGLDQAMRKVSEEMKKTYAVIAEEFGLANLQLQMGRARNEVLHELGARTGVDDLKALAAILIQADKFGSSVAQALRVQSDSMRTRRRQMAEEKAAKTAVKLIFPLVLFIFPAIFIVLVGPAAITMINEMFPAMSGGK